MIFWEKNVRAIFYSWGSDDRPPGGGGGVGGRSGQLDGLSQTFRPNKISGSNFSKKSKILKGCLPPEDGSDRRETLGKRVSDDFAKMIFRAENIFWETLFEKNPKF